MGCRWGQARWRQNGRTANTDGLRDGGRQGGRSLDENDYHLQVIFWMFAESQPRTAVQPERRRPARRLVPESSSISPHGPTRLAPKGFETPVRRIGSRCRFGTSVRHVGSTYRFRCIGPRRRRCSNRQKPNHRRRSPPARDAARCVPRMSRLQLPRLGSSAVPALHALGILRRL